MKMLTILAILAIAAIMSFDVFGGNGYVYPSAYQREKAEENRRKAIDTRLDNIEDELRELKADNKMLRAQRRREMQEMPRTYGSTPAQPRSGAYPVPTRTPAPVYYGN